MTQVLLLVVVPFGQTLGGYLLVRWSERRRLAREAYLTDCLRARLEVDARIEAHWLTLPASLKGERNV